MTIYFRHEMAPSQWVTPFKWHPNFILYLPLRSKSLHAWKMFFSHCVKFVSQREFFVCCRTLVDFLTQQRRKWLSFSHKSESNILNKVTVLYWWPIHLLSHGPLSHCLTQSTCGQCMTVFVFSTPTSIAFMQHR